MILKCCGLAIILADFGVLFHDFEVLWPSAHQYPYSDEFEATVSKLEGDCIPSVGTVATDALIGHFSIGGLYSTKLGIIAHRDLSWRTSDKNLDSLRMRALGPINYR
jgi:hypothetical protein